MPETRSVGVNTDRVRLRSVHTQTLPYDMNSNETIEIDQSEDELANERPTKPLHLTSMNPHTPSYSSTPFGTQKQPRQSKLISIEINSTSIGKGRGKLSSIEREMRRATSHLMVKSPNQQGISSNLLALPENVSSMHGSMPPKKSLKYMNENESMQQKDDDDDDDDEDGNDKNTQTSSVLNKPRTSATPRQKRSRSVTPPKKQQNISLRNRSKLEDSLDLNAFDEHSNLEIAPGQSKAAASQPALSRKPSRSSIVITKIAPTLPKPAVVISRMQETKKSAQIIDLISDDDDRDTVDENAQFIHNRNESEVFVQNENLTNRELNRSKKSKNRKIKPRPAEIKPYYDPILERIIPRRSERLRLKRLREEKMRLERQQQKLIKDKDELYRKRKRRKYKKKSPKELFQNIDLKFVTLRKNNEGYHKQQKMIRKWREE
jgi:hypothetical protein